MKLSDNTLHPLNLPRSIDTIIYLISQELKIRRLFNGLRKAGIEDCAFEPYLDRLILAEMGLDETNETMALYCKVMDKRCRKIRTDDDSIMKESFKVYIELSSARTENF